MIELLHNKASQLYLETFASIIEESVIDYAGCDEDKASHLKGRAKVNIRQKCSSIAKPGIIYEGGTEHICAPHIIDVATQLARLHAIRCCLAKNAIPSNTHSQAQIARETEIARNAIAFVRNHKQGNPGQQACDYIEANSRLSFFTISKHVDELEKNMQALRAAFYKSNKLQKANI